MDPPASETPSEPIIAQWIFDTRGWYPEATQPKQLELHAERALALLSPKTRANIVRYFQARDAKMALASALLKHHAIAKLFRPQWYYTSNREIFTTDQHLKPIYVDPETGTQPVAFNVTHQDGIVAIIAVANYPPERGAVEVGVDIVCTSERRRRDHDRIARDGWSEFIETHAEVFSPAEVRRLKYQVLSFPGLLPTNPTAEQVTDGKLRAFYSLWALREAYIKMKGEALMAEWLSELEFPSFTPPKPTERWGMLEKEEDGQIIKNTEIRFRGERVEDVNMCLRSVGRDFMIATAVRTPGRKEDALGWKLGAYEVLNLDDVLDYAYACKSSYC